MSISYPSYNLSENDETDEDIYECNCGEGLEEWDNSDDGYGDADYEKKGLVRIDV